MPRIVIPITLSFMGAGMPWTLEGEITTEWTAANVQSPYVDYDYVVADYFADEEWTVLPAQSETWTLVA